MPSVTTKSPEETIKWGEKLGCILSSGDIVLLRGGLGAGKTHFAKGVARGLGIGEHVTSPTFTLINEYYGRLPLYHFDTYRLCSEEELDDLGLEEYFFGNGVCLIEWPEKLSSYLPREYLEIYLEGVGDEERRLDLKAAGERYEKLLAGLFGEVE